MSHLPGTLDVQKYEAIALVCALEAASEAKDAWEPMALKTLCIQAARMIRRLRPDVAFPED